MLLKDEIKKQNYFFKDKKKTTQVNLRGLSKSVIQVMRLELSHRRKQNYKNYFPTNQNWKKNYVEKDEKMTLANPDQLEKLMK
jgi:hypothetical protein